MNRKAYQLCFKSLSLAPFSHSCRPPTTNIDTYGKQLLCCDIHGTLKTKWNKQSKNTVRTTHANERRDDIACIAHVFVYGVVLWNILQGCLYSWLGSMSCVLGIMMFYDARLLLLTCVSESEKVCQSSQKTLI